MRFLVAILILSSSALGEEGIPNSVRTGKLPLGLDGVANIDGIKKFRIDALKQYIETLKGRHERGLIEVSFFPSGHLARTQATCGICLLPTSAWFSLDENAIVRLACNGVQKVINLFEP